MTYKKYINPIQSVTEAAPNTVPNNAGGFSFAVDKWMMFERFLILGSIGGTYYVDEKKLTIEHIRNFQECLNENPEKFVRLIADVSMNNRAPKVDPAILALAFAFTNDKAKVYVEHFFTSIIRTGTHLFQFVSYVTEMRGWGRALKRMVGNWYSNKNESDLVYQLTKYQSREGWSNRDLMRLSHPKPITDTQKEIYKWVTKGELPSNEMIRAIAKLPEATETEVIRSIEKYHLTREMIPTVFLKSSNVWSALLKTMPMTAMVRNLGTMTANGTLTIMGTNTNLVVDRLTNRTLVEKSKLHPLAILNAYQTYEKGEGFKGNNSWIPIQSILDALDDAFYLSFGNVEATGKRIVYAVDVSASMDWNTIAGMNITPKVASAALALVLAHTEKNYYIHGFSDTFRDLKITKKDTLSSAMAKVRNLPASYTNPGVGIQWAIDNKIPVDAFVVLTDSETNGGNHYHQLLREYRKLMGINTKVIIVAMESNGFTLADPSDPGMLDVVGFDTSVPQIITEFLK